MPPSSFPRRCGCPCPLVQGSGLPLRSGRRGQGTGSCCGVFVGVGGWQNERGLHRLAGPPRFKGLSFLLGLRILHHRPGGPLSPARSHCRESPGLEPITGAGFFISPVGYWQRHLWLGATPGFAKMDKMPKSVTVSSLPTKKWDDSTCMKSVTVVTPYHRRRHVERFQRVS